MSGMSGKMEIVYEPDTDIDIEEFKLEATDTDQDVIAGGEDIDPLNTDQESQGTFRTNQKHSTHSSKVVDSKDIISCEICGFKGLEKGIAVHKKKKHSKFKHCDLCVYAAINLFDLKKHKEITHKALLYPCDQCEYAATEKVDLKKHRQFKHEGVRFRYPCDKCEYAATRQGELKKHKESIHVGIRYPCDQCEFTATQQGHLKKHKQSIHEGIRYPCDQCEYSATVQGSLKRHKQSKHEEIRYPCDQCECTFSDMSELRKHRNRKHMTATSQLVSTPSIPYVQVQLI